MAGMCGSEHGDRIRLEHEVRVEHQEQSSSWDHVRRSYVACPAGAQALMRAAAYPGKPATPGRTPSHVGDELCRAIRGPVVRDDYVKIRAGLAFKGHQHEPEVVFPVVRRNDSPNHTGQPVTTISIRPPQVYSVVPVR
jgi:hypothetical protein